MGDGNDIIDISGTLFENSFIDTGDNDDIINIQRVDEGNITIDSGRGDDTVTLQDISGEYDSGSLNLGDGEDTLKIYDTLVGTQSIFDGGDGVEDNLILVSVTKGEWSDGIKDIFVNFEKIIFKDKTIIRLDADGDEIIDNSDQNLLFRNIEYHSSTQNGTDHPDYTEVNLTTGSGDDTIIVDDDIGSQRDIEYAGERVVSTNDGDDTILVADDIQHGAIVDTGSGDDTVQVGGDLSNRASIIMGDGNDTINVSALMFDNASIDTGVGYDTVYLNTIKNSSLFTGSNDDTISIQRVDKGEATIDTGSGDDILYLQDVSSEYDSGSVLLGDGDDTLTIDDTLLGTQSIFYGGDGVNTLVLTTVTQESWDDGLKDIFVEFERVLLADVIITILPQIDQTIEILSPPIEKTVIYKAITLEVNATGSQTAKAINQTIVSENNRTIAIKGTKSNNLFYFYNLPLQKGSNNIVITATDENNESISQNYTINSDANGTAPIGMRASTYSGVGELNTNIEIGTLLDTREYLFDSDGDGVIDQINSDGNFTLNLTKEGRYRPRVTIRTQDNLLYSSNYYAMALDVKSSADQKDPIGAEPMDVAKEFVEALISDDRERVERLVGSNQKLINFIYGHPNARNFLANIYKNITKWEQTYHPMGDASVKILFDAEGQSYGGGFEMNVMSSQLNNGRIWTIGFIY